MSSTWVIRIGKLYINIAHFGQFKISIDGREIEGYGPEGMSTLSLHGDDAQALIAYLASLAPVDAVAVWRTNQEGGTS